MSGAQLTDRARRQAQKFGAEALSVREVVGLEARGSARVVRFGDGSEIAARAVVLATGVAYRALEAPGVAELTGRGLYYGSATTEASACARQVTLLVRGESLERSMSHYLIQQLATLGNVTVRTCTEVAAAHGDEHLEELTLRHTRSGVTDTVSSGYVFVFIGAAPRTDWLDGVVARDARGFIQTGPDLLVDGRRPAGWPLDRDPYYLECSLPGVFVAGDVRAESVKRVASAVGEGAMAVTLVHRYLEDQ